MEDLDKFIKDFEEADLKAGGRRPKRQHKWNTDDDLLVIDLYLRRGTIGEHEAEVRTLVDLFGGDITPASIAMGLGNVEFLATNGARGLPNPSQHMRATWEAHKNRPEDVRAKAREIRDRRTAARRASLPPLTEEQKARIAERRRNRD